jgi:hypothetical protein
VDARQRVRFDLVRVEDFLHPVESQKWFAHSDSSPQVVGRV